MTSIYSYQKLITRETSTWMAMPYDVDGTPLVTELTTLAGITYVAVPDGVTLPPQPAGITLTAVTLTSALTAQIIAASSHAQLIKQRQAERTTDEPLSAEQAALWAAQQLEALGLATAGDVNAAALDILKARRYESQIAGTTWNTHPVATDQVSVSNMTAAVVLSQLPGFTSIQWKFADGSFATLSGSDLTAMAQAASTHVQAAFDNEAALIPKVQADITTDIETGWPT